MRKIIFFTLFLWIYTGAVVSAGTSIKISAPPSIWAQQSGQVLTGPIIDLVAELFGEFNIKIETKILPWARAIDQMKSGELDLIPVVFYSNERAAFMEFTIPYVDVPTAVFVPRGKTFQFKTLNDLRDRRGLMVREDSISEGFKYFEPKLNIVKVTNYEQIFNMLGHHRADYAVAAKYGFVIHAKKLGYENQIEPLPVPVANRKIHFAFSKKSKFLSFLPEINEKLRHQKMNGRMEKIVERAIDLASER